MGEKYLLLTIVFSHFNEKVRWALDYYRVEYTEHRLLPGLHIFSVKPYVVGRRRGGGGGNSEDDASPRKPNTSSSSSSLSSSSSSPYSTPCLVILDAETGKSKQSIQESSDILRYLSQRYSSSTSTTSTGADDDNRPNLFLSCGGEAAQEQTISTLVKHYDETIGIAARTYVYYDMLAVSKWRALLPFAAMGFKNNVGLLQSVLWAFLITPLAIIFFKGDRRKYEDAEVLCRKEFKAASELLESSKYLAGEHLSAADITFASLSYPVLGVTHEDGYQHFPPDLAAFSERGRAFQQSLRATKAGQHALRLFKEERFLHETAGVVPLQKKTLLGLW